MAKRGPKSYEESLKGIVPMRVIATRMGISERTVRKDYQSAKRKLKAVPGAFSILLDCVHAVAEPAALRCGSVECDRDYVARFAGAPVAGEE